MIFLCKEFFHAFHSHWHILFPGSIQDRRRGREGVARNFKLLFGDYSILLPKSLIRTSGGKGTVPDGIIVDFKGNR